MDTFWGAGAGTFSSASVVNQRPADLLWLWQEAGVYFCMQLISVLGSWHTYGDQSILQKT